MHAYYNEIKEKMERALECAERLVDSVIGKDFSELKYTWDEEMAQIEFEIFNESAPDFLEKRDLSSLKLINFKENILIYEVTRDIIVVITFYRSK